MSGTNWHKNAISVCATGWWRKAQTWAGYEHTLQIKMSLKSNQFTADICRHFTMWINRFNAAVKQNITSWTDWFNKVGQKFWKASEIFLYSQRGHAYTSQGLSDKQGNSGTGQCCSLFCLNVASAAWHYMCISPQDALLCIYSLRMKSKHTFTVFGSFI